MSVHSVLERHLSASQRASRRASYGNPNALREASFANLYLTVSKYTTRVRRSYLDEIIDWYTTAPGCKNIGVLLRKQGAHFGPFASIAMRRKAVHDLGNLPSFECIVVATVDGGRERQRWKSWLKSERGSASHQLLLMDGRTSAPIGRTIV
jgi:hypothetical protein